MELDCWYIPESWKNITANTTATVNALMGLPMEFY
jgi:hypothetical protein